MKNYFIISMVFGAILGILSVLVEKLSLLHLYYKIVINIAYYVMIIITILITSSLRVDYKLSFSQFGIGYLEMFFIGLLFRFFIKLILKQ